ncbi:MAG: XrtA-associated tyrosine autokinase [Betaproteobacteria bacterium]
MSLIEQAAKRLEQLREAGVDIPEDDAPEEVIARPLRPSRMDGGAEKKIAVEGASQPPAQSRQIELDLNGLAAAGIISPTAPRSHISDEYRVIKRPLITNAMGKGASPILNGNLIMVTSAMPGEGKTFSAINLAMSIAMELDNTVMLVDADVARPSVLSMLGKPPEPGLLDMLVDDSIPLSSLLLRTNVEKLTILPSGTQHDRATELLASDAMGRLVDDMSTRYPDRIIIFDSPPLLMTTESRVLASHMGQIVMIVHAQRTLHGQVKQALATIANCPVKLLLLNQSRAKPGDGYGYGYGYDYGYGYGYGKGG